MKRLRNHDFDPLAARSERREFRALMASLAHLGESKHVLPFFRKNSNLALLIGYYFPHLRNVNVVATEYPIYGDFKADLLVGDRGSRQYVIVEFEDGGPESVFKRRGRKATRDWAPRFEGAFSQLVDWIWKLDDMRATTDFQDVFGSRKAKFQTLMIIGKGMELSDQEKTRLDWRVENVTLSNGKISCVSFEQLLEDLDYRLKTYHQV